MRGERKLLRLLSQRVEEVISEPDAAELEGPSWFSCPGQRPGRWGSNSCKEGSCQGGERCALMRERGLDSHGRPLKFEERPPCEAFTRAGGLCQQRVVPGRRRCRYHGGLSTGPKTPDGRQRVLAGLRRWIAAGRPKGRRGSA